MQRISLAEFEEYREIRQTLRHLCRRSRVHQYLCIPKRSWVGHQAAVLAAMLLQIPISSERSLPEGTAWTAMWPLAATLQCVSQPRGSRRIVQSQDAIPSADSSRLVLPAIASWQSLPAAQRPLLELPRRESPPLPYSQETQCRRPIRSRP